MDAASSAEGESEPVVLNDAALRSVLSALPDMVAVADATGRALWMNQVALHMTGRREDEMGTLTLWDVLPPDEHELAAQGITLTLASREEVIPVEYHILRPDGTTVPVEATGSVVEIDGDTYLVLVGRRVEFRMGDHIDRLVQGGPIDELIDAGLERLRVRWPGYAVTFLRRELDGTPVVMGDALPKVLAPTATSEDGSMPWELAVATGDEQYLAIEDFPADAREAAAEAGYSACIAVPVPDPAGFDACVVFWRRPDAPFRFERIWTRTPAFLLIRLALERRAAQATLAAAARTDPLTKLGNRTAFFDRVAAPRAAGIGVLFVDLDDFKPVNDALGHRAGDAVLEEFARRMRAASRDGDIVARLGGDEFAVLMTDLAATSDAVALAERLLAATAAPFAVDGEAGPVEVRVGTSIGIAVDLGATSSAVDLLDVADRALYEAKREGKGVWRLAE